MILPTTLAEPWLGFLRELDDLAGEVTVFHCLGGFALTAVYGRQRSTNDLDVFTIFPYPQMLRLLEAGSKGGELFKKHRVYLECVSGVSSVPYEYESRLAEVFSGSFHNLRLQVLDPYDLALSKLQRDNDRDFEDVMYLARKGPLDAAILQQRYREELRPYVLGSPEICDDALANWIEAIGEQRRKLMLHNGGQAQGQ